jgi:hypothetical protein
MNSTKLLVRAALEQRCMEFLERKLSQSDTARLEYFRLYDRTGKIVTRGVWGRCTYPNRRKGLGYRIRCSVAIAHGEFPFRINYAIGTRSINREKWEWIRREDWFQTREEAFVWIAGHEAFHWLRHSRQIPGANYETQANRFGFGWLDEWRVAINLGQVGLPGTELHEYGDFAYTPEAVEVA